MTGTIEHMDKNYCIVRIDTEAWAIPTDCLELVGVVEEPMELPEGSE